MFPQSITNLLRMSVLWPLSSPECNFFFIAVCFVLAIATRNITHSNVFAHGCQPWRNLDAFRPHSNVFHIFCFDFIFSSIFVLLEHPLCRGSPFVHVRVTLAGTQTGSMKISTRNANTLQHQLPLLPHPTCHVYHMIAHAIPIFIL